PQTKYKYETEVLDDECKPTVAVQAALKASSDPAVTAGVTHYCSVAAIATIDTYHKAGMPALGWGRGLPGIAYSPQQAGPTRVTGQTDKLSRRAPCQGTSGSKSDTRNETAGPAAEGTLACVEGAPTEKLPGGKRFLEAYAKAGFKEPSEAYGPFAYVAANIVI